MSPSNHLALWPAQMLKEPGKVAQSKNYMWVMKGGPSAHSGIVYHYDPSRSQSVPKTLLKDYTGYLQTDGYAGYNGILGHDGVTGLGCWLLSASYISLSRRSKKSPMKLSGNVGKPTQPRY